MALFSRLLPRSSIRFLSGKKISVRNSLYQERERSVAQEMKERCHRQTEILQGFETEKKKKKRERTLHTLQKLLPSSGCSSGLKWKAKFHGTERSSRHSLQGCCQSRRAPWLRINRNRGLHPACSYSISLITTF